MLVQSDHAILIDCCQSFWGWGGGKRFTYRFRLVPWLLAKVTPSSWVWSVGASFGSSTQNNGLPSTLPNSGRSTVTKGGNCGSEHGL